MTPAPNPPPVAESVELLPCPICARPPIRVGRLGVGGVLCVGTTLDPVEHRVATYGATQAVADQSWNTRTDPAIAASHEAGRIAGVREGLERAAKVAEGERPKNPVSDWTDYARTRDFAATTIAELIRTLSKGEIDGE